MLRDFTQELDLRDIEFIDEPRAAISRHGPDPDASGLSPEELAPTRDDEPVLRDRSRSGARLEDEVTRVWVRPYTAVRYGLRVPFTARRAPARGRRS